MANNEKVWIGFSPTQQFTRCNVHFLPIVSGSASLPHLQCRIAMFCGAQAPTIVEIDGAKIGYPDGLRLDAVFNPMPTPTSGFVGVSISLMIEQTRFDLRGSDVVFELIQNDNALKYRPRCLSAPPQSSACWQFKDGHASASLLVVNHTDTEKTCNFSNKKVTLAPYEVQEMALDNYAAASLAPAVDTSWGTLRGSLISNLDESRSGLNFFQLWRDPESRRLISVTTL